MDFDDDRSVASARTEEVIRAVPRVPLRDADKYDLRADTANHQMPPASPGETDLGLAQQSGDSMQSSAEFAPDGEKFRTAGGTDATASDLSRDGYAAADSARIAVGDTAVSPGGPSAMESEAVAGAGGEPLTSGVVAGTGAEGVADGGRAAVTRGAGEVSTGAAAGVGVEGLADGGRAGATSAGDGALTGVVAAAGAGRGVAAVDSAAGGLENPGPLLRVVRRQELAFAVVGGFNTALGIGMTVVWLAVLGDNVPPSVAVAAAYAVSIAVAFVLHRTLVFRVRGHLLRDFLRFVAVNSGGLLLNMVLLELAVSVWHFPDKPAAVVVMGLVAVASYFGHRHISFHRRPAVESRDVVG
ncbi:GtrA family protein [Nocardia brasiliensis]